MKHVIPLVIVFLSAVVPGYAQKISFETHFFKIIINGKGYIESIKDKTSASGKEYCPKEITSPLLALAKGTSYIYPSAIQWNATRKALRVSYPNHCVAKIKVTQNHDYLRLELTSLEPRNNVEAIVWGPYSTIISDKIGETVCVVRNKEFSIGMQSLNINTTEGLPMGDDNAGGGGFIDPLPGQNLPDSLKDKVGKPVPVNVNVTGDMPDYVRLYRGSAAVKKDYGSDLQLFSRDRRIPRNIILNDEIKDYKQYVMPVNVDFQGSAVALFGCPEPRTLDIIEKIEWGEKLPHPMLNGVWIKRSSLPGEAYMLNEGDPLKAIEYAKLCNFNLIHIGDIFQTWGHFGLKTKRFDGSLKIKEATEAARKEGISLGVHTLTMFTSTNDAYVSPVPSDSLCKAGSSLLSKAVSDSEETIYVEDSVWFTNPGRTHTVKIEKELIAYKSISPDKPYRLLNCKRGQFGTRSTAHSKGSTVDKLVNNSYSGFYPDIHLQDAYAKRLAEVCNTTGIGLMDFDGFGGGSPDGHGTYAAVRFVDTWYKNLNAYPLTCGAGTFHYYWHIYAFMNWGEPWYNALRESQVNYRIENQRYFDRNLMPGMLGWFTLNSEFRPEETEWIQARSAGFNAGYLLRVDAGIEANGFKDQIFEAIREWQKARRANVFSESQKQQFQNPKKEFHLVKKDDAGWELFPVLFLGKFRHQYRMTQTGEPVTGVFDINNIYKEQPLQFYIQVTANDNNPDRSIAHVQIKLNDYQTITLNKPLKAGDRVCCDGRKVLLCDNTWNKKEEICNDKMLLCEAGKNKITVSYENSAEKLPTLEFEFKLLGNPELVRIQKK